MGKVYVPQVTDGYHMFSRHFQAEISELMVALEYLTTYLDDLLCITKASLDNHFDHLRLVLTRLQEAGLKVNAPKLKFCSLEMEYLWYILTWIGIKLQPKKVQAILTTTPPKQVKDCYRSWAWSSTIEIIGQDIVKCLPH